MDTFALTKIGILNRLGWWFLPPVSRPAGSQFSFPDGFEDEIVLRTVVSLRIRDRLRVMFFGRVTVETRTLTEFKPGNLATHSGMDTY